MPFADFDRKLRDVNRLRQILEVLIKNELGYFVDSLKLKKFLPMSRTMDGRKFVRASPQPYRVVKAAEELGGTFVKLGQLLSIRPDLIPPEYCEAFRALQDNIPPFSFQQAKGIVEKELGKKLKDAFLSFDVVPVAAASVGQVHIAKLKNGKKVAVKVQRPNIQEVFRTDIDIMYLFVYLMRKYHEPEIIDPKEIVEEFEDYTQKELSYINEAKNIDVFSRNFPGEGETKIPKVHWELTTEKVLTMEYIEGKKLSTLIKSKRLFNRKLIARNIVDSIFIQVFEKGVFHADPHPGNIIVLPSYRIAWLDFGIVGRLGEQMRESATDLFIGIVTKDLEAVSKALLDIGVRDDLSDEDMFKADLVSAMGRFYDVPLDRMKLGDMFHEMIQLARKHRLKLPKDFILLGKTVITTEGVAQELDPGFNFIQVAKPFAEKIAKKRTSPRYLLHRAWKSAGEIKTFISEVPKQTKDLVLRIKQAEKASERIDADLKQLSHEIDKSSNRIALGLLITAFLISATIIMNFEQPKFLGFPALSFAGFAIAFFLFFVLVLSIVREKS